MPAPALRGPGGADAGEHRCRGKGRPADLRRAEPAGGPPGAPAAGPGARPREAGRCASGPYLGPRRHPPGRAQGRRRLRAARSQLPPAARAPHAGDGAGEDPGDPQVAEPSGGGGVRGDPHGLSGRPGGGLGRRAAARPAGQPGLRHLHLGLDGRAQGGGDPAPQRRGHDPLGPHDLYARGVRGPAGLHLHLLRHVGVRDLRHPGRGRQAAPRRKRPGPAGAPLQGRGGAGGHGALGHGRAAAPGRVAAVDPDGEPGW